ncbi:MAG: prephenate dehydratase [Candidatus Helarchaeota archaeon]
MPDIEKELEELRTEISQLDKKLVQLLDSRAKISKKIGLLKEKLNQPIIDRAREQKVYEYITSHPLEYLTESQIRAIYKEIIASSRAIQQGKKRVAYLGPQGTFSDQAAKTYFSQAETDFFVVNKISEVFRKVKSQEVDYGIVPVENSLYGSVPDTLDLLLESNLKVCGEIILRICHNLIVLKEMPLSAIQIVLSKDQAFGQCRQFLDENLSHAEFVETKSTARAVELLSNYENAAAIGTELAAEIYGGIILAKGIEDNPNNYTRFFVIGTEDTLPSGNDKSSIIFSVKHIPGALLNALKSFSSRNINLTKLESRPSRFTPWEYFFYTDFEGHISNPEVQDALRDLQKNTLFIKILGSYKAHK